MSTVNINCPQVGTFTADGTAQMEVAYMQTVALDSAHSEFNITGDAFQYFSLAEEASGSTLEYTVSIANKAGLKTALGGWMKAAGATNSSSQNVETFMKEYLRDEINALIGADGVGAALQASVIKSLAFTQFETDAQSGADALVEALDGDQNKKNSIGLQFPKARYPEVFASTLPAAAEDSLTFQFTISSSIVVSDDLVDVTTATNAAGAANPTIASALNVTKSRIVHIIATKA
jgi:hypothetical protein